MDYFDCFVGGPADGKKERSGIQSRSYSRVVGQRFIERNVPVLAIYEHKENRISGECTERIYQYVRSMPWDDGIDFVNENAKTETD